MAAHGIFLAGYKVAVIQDNFAFGNQIGFKSFGLSELKNPVLRDGVRAQRLVFQIVTVTQGRFAMILPRAAGPLDLSRAADDKHALDREVLAVFIVVAFLGVGRKGDIAVAIGQSIANIAMCDIWLGIISRV